MQEDSESTLWNFFLPLIFTLIFGGMISLVYYVTYILKSYLKSKFTSCLIIENSDPAFDWLLDYLISKGYITHTMNNVTCKTERMKKTPDWLLNNDIASDSEKPQLNYLPSSGYHSFIYQGIKINIFHYIGRPTTEGWDRVITTPESYVLSCFGPWNIKILKSICEESINYATNKDKNLTNIFAVGRFCRWEKVQSKRNRLFNTVILDSNIAEEILEDIQVFKKSRDWYTERGVPYRRGYVLYGPPGTGKTSFALAVAAEAKLNICTLNLSGDKVSDFLLNELLQKSPMNSIILLEDIDAIFVERTSVGESNGLRITFSGLLNALDGVSSQEGRILFMSTNHLEKLDPALLRPGRADVHVQLNYATKYQIKKMFQRFYPEEKEEILEKFAMTVPENKLSMAKLQGHFLRHKNDSNKAVNTANTLTEINEFINEMNIKEWLFRLNLDEFVNEFLKENILKASDMKGINESQLVKFGVKKKGDQKRIIDMIKGDDLSKKAFSLMSHQSIRSFLWLYMNNIKEIEAVVQLIPENCITEFHLRDIFERNGKKNLENDINDFIQRIKNSSQNQKVKKSETSTKKYPKETPTQILERLKLESFIEKFKENKVLDAEYFYELNEGELAVIGIESYGMRKLLMKEIDNFNKKSQEVEIEGSQIHELLNERVQNILKKSGSIQY